MVGVAYDKGRGMTVKELIEQLSALDPNLRVMMSKDGDAFRPLYNAEGDYFVGPDEDYVMERQAFIKQLYMFPESYEDWEPCIVLWPEW